jgi:DNA-binding XRE family transcriptional regulator
MRSAQPTPDDFTRHLEQLMQDPEFRQEWEADEAEYRARVAVIQARLAAEMTQKQLAERSGIDQRAISRIESGNTNPTVRTLGRIAKGLGKKLKIEFV